MNIPRSIFRQYDVRGIVGQELTPELARGLGQALATMGWEAMGRAPVIAVGRDNRPSGVALAEGLIAGIQAAGGTAVDVGEMPTPGLYFATCAPGMDVGVQVTGSHNPPEYNGFKLVLGGKSLYGDTIQRIHQIITRESWRAGVGSARRMARCCHATRGPSSSVTDSTGRSGWWSTAGTEWRVLWRCPCCRRSARTSFPCSAIRTAPSRTTFPIRPSSRT